MTKPALENRLREQRHRKGLSSPELAQIVGTSAQTVCRMETSDQPLTLAWIKRFADALGCDPCDILPVSFLRRDTGEDQINFLRTELRKRNAKIADLERRLSLIRDAADIWGEHV